MIERLSHPTLPHIFKVCHHQNSSFARGFCWIEIVASIQHGLVAVAVDPLDAGFRDSQGLDEDLGGDGDGRRLGQQQHGFLTEQRVQRSNRGRRRGPRRRPRAAELPGPDRVLAPEAERAEGVAEGAGDEAHPGSEEADGTARHAR